MSIPQDEYWRKCTTCKKPIGFNTKYWICSVSTCNRVRTDLVFCDLKCFDAHVPVMNHRDAGAFEKTSPRKETAQREAAQEKHSLDSKPAGISSIEKKPSTEEENEILVVASKVKAYIRSKAMMNTSDAVMEVLSERVRKYADIGIKNANQNGRKTVMARDI